MQATSEPLIAHLKSAIDKFFKQDKRPQHSSFKAFGDYWHGEWTNNLQDRDAEWFSAKAIKDYVARVDLGLTPLPKLWVWHGGKAVEIGEALQIAIVEKDGVLVASAIGKFSESPRAQRAKSHFNETKEILGMSHGFHYPENGKKDRVYHAFNTFELSVLPIEVAANPYTAFESIKEFQVDEKKYQFYVKVFGEEDAAKLKGEMENKAANLSQFAEYKEFFSVADAVAEKNESPVQVPSTSPETESALKAIVQEIIPDMGNLVTTQLGVMKRVKEQADTIETLQKQVQSMALKMAAMDDELKAKPRSASSAEETEVDDEEAKKKLEAKAASEGDPYHGTIWENLIEKSAE